MLISEFDTFVKSSDFSADRSREEQLEIAIYGLAAEVGSIVATVKKRLLSEEMHAFNQPNSEIIEELGDAIWYCFAISRIENAKKPVNIFIHSIKQIEDELNGSGKTSEYIRNILDKNKKEEFIRSARDFPKKARDIHFENYQAIAFLSARTKGRTLVEVCLSVLWQLSAELLRHNLPADEKLINTTIKDRPINDVLGEIAWHIAALCSVYNLNMSDIAQKNIDKISQRLPGPFTPLHDEGRPANEMFPRKFNVAFVSVSGNRARMYVDATQVGDDLTNNSYREDGYRFHDVMHLANVAFLGWSPVLRKLFKRKRKSDKKIDEVEDGARAIIVEEAVIKAIHTEGQRIASLKVGPSIPGPEHLFPDRRDITFTLLKFIRTFVSDLEVGLNSYWEWERVIIEGYKIFYQLHCETQGTVTVDLEARSLSFSPHVHIKNRGIVAGVGTSIIQIPRGKSKKPRPELTAREADAQRDVDMGYVRTAGRKQAILAALGITDPTPAQFQNLEITELDQDKISVKGLGEIAEKIWEKSIITFRTILLAEQGRLYCTALALSDN